jgi:hypothetical protein
MKTQVARLTWAAVEKIKLAGFVAKAEEKGACYVMEKNPSRLRLTGRVGSNDKVRQKQQQQGNLPRR